MNWDANFPPKLLTTRPWDVNISYSSLSGSCGKRGQVKIDNANMTKKFLILRNYSSDGEWEKLLWNYLVLIVEFSLFDSWGGHRKKKKEKKN